MKVTKKTLIPIKTKKICPRCAKRLFTSDIPEYSYLCTNCDENFYKFEVK